MTELGETYYVNKAPYCRCKKCVDESIPGDIETVRRSGDAVDDKPKHWVIGLCNDCDSIAYIAMTDGKHRCPDCTTAWEEKKQPMPRLDDRKRPFKTKDERLAYMIEVGERLNNDGGTEDIKCMME